MLQPDHQPAIRPFPHVDGGSRVQVVHNRNKARTTDTAQSSAQVVLGTLAIRTHDQWHDVTQELQNELDLERQGQCQMVGESEVLRSERDRWREQEKHAHLAPSLYLLQATAAA